MGTPSQSYGTSLAIWDYTCYLPPDTSERAPPNPSHAGWYLIYLPGRDGRLSWPSWLDSAPAGSRTGDLLITSPTPNRYTTKTNYKLQAKLQISLSPAGCKWCVDVVTNPRRNGRLLFGDVGDFGGSVTCLLVFVSRSTSDWRLWISASKFYKHSHITICLATYHMISHHIISHRIGIEDKGSKPLCWPLRHV